MFPGDKKKNDVLFEIKTRNIAFVEVVLVFEDITKPPSNTTAEIQNKNIVN